jgi:ribosome-associated protein
MDGQPHTRDFSSELIFSASRSGGAGGQNVNKVSSKVELRFHIDSSSLLNPEEKSLLKEKVAGRINNDGFLQIVSQAERSQLLNKQAAVKKFYQLLEKNFRPVKKRNATKPTHTSVQKRLQNKKKTSQRKSSRRNNFNDDL